MVVRNVSAVTSARATGLASPNAIANTTTVVTEVNRTEMEVSLVI